MRLPRRVPWASISELDEVCAWIYSGSANDETKRKAVDRIAAWKFSTALPHALESTWMILSVVLQDTEEFESKPASSSFTSLRQAYALAIVRLVNGLVDPLQQGAYARPISAIAAQIGLPGWFVELRHAATHEDLPSLEVLREAAAEAMSWLLHNYFLPTLSPVNTADVPLPEISLLAPLLKEYKTLLKSTTRDASLKTRNKGEITRILRQLERWIGEAKVAWGLGPGRNGDDEEKERWAIDQLCIELLNKGGLVPVAKKKRLDNSVPGIGVPPNTPIWSPLLIHVQSNHSTFASQLLGHAVNCLLTTSDEDPSFDQCLSGWVVWFVQTWGEEQTDCSLEETVSLVLTELDRIDAGDLDLVKKVRPLLDSMTSTDPELQARVKHMLQARVIDSSNVDEEVTFEVMEERLAALKAKMAASAAVPVGVNTPMSTAQDLSRNPAPGIRLLTAEEGWRPCPIGIDPRPIARR